MGQIPAEYLPPKELWSQRVYTLSEFTQLPQRFNSTEELPERRLARGSSPCTSCRGTSSSRIGPPRHRP